MAMKKTAKKATKRTYKDGNQGKKGEAPGQRRTVARRGKVARMNAKKRTDELNKNIKKQQGSKPY